LKILYKYLCKGKDIGYLPGNFNNVFFCDVAMRVNSQTISVSAATTWFALIKNITANFGLASLIL